MTQDGPPLDVNRIVDALARHQVEYMLVGAAQNTASCPLARPA